MGIVLRVCGFLIGAAVVAVGCTPDAGTAAGESATSMERLEKEGRWIEAAAAHRDEALRVGAERGDDHVKRAILAYLMANRLDQAERFAEEILERDPKRSEVLFYVGDSQRVMNEYEASRSTLERLLDRDPGHVPGTIALSHVLLRLGRAQAALEWTDRLLRAPGVAPEQRTLVEIDSARALRRLGRKAEAADRLAEVLEADPYNLVALAEAAQVFALIGKQDLASGVRELHAWLSERGHQLSNEDETKLYSTGPASPAGSARIALQMADKRDFLRALSGLERLHETAQVDAAVSASLARLWLRLERPHEALAVMESATRKTPASLEIRLLVVDARRALRQAVEARAALFSASEWLATSVAGPQADGEAALETHIAAALLQLDPGGSLEKAAECIARAAASAPSTWRLLFASGRLALERGDARQALELFESAKVRLRAGAAAPVDLLRWTAVAKGFTGDLRSAAREIMALIREHPPDLENFQAFARVFGSKRGEPEVERVLVMKTSLETKRAALQTALLSLAETPFRQSGQAYIDVGRLLAAEGRRDAALDCFFLAGDLDPPNAAGLRAAETLLTGARDVFVRLRAARGILERSKDDPAAFETLVRAYLDAGLRFSDAEALAIRLASVRPGAESDRLLASVREKRKGD